MNKNNKNLKSPSNSKNSNQIVSASSSNVKGGSSGGSNVKKPSQGNNNSANQPSNSKNNKGDKKPKLSKEEKKQKKLEKKQKRQQGCLIFFIVTLFALTAFMFLGAGVLFRILDETPELNLISVEPNIYTSIVYDKDGIEIDRFHGEENREYMTLDNISPYFANAMVAVEDQRFYEHDGIDLRGIARATMTTVQNKITGATGVQGASTITQQLIKNNVTKVNRNTFTTKVQEQYLALMYEKRLVNQFGSKNYAKDYILELYLNTIGLGHGYNGVEAAALGYFNKEAIDLTLAESACIASITNNPSLYSPRTQPENNKSRVEKILNHMLEQGMISRYEYQEALAETEDLYSRVSNGYSENKIEGNIIHGYFEDAVFEQVSKDLQEQHNLSSAQANNLIYNAGLQIHTTKDTAMQKKVEESYSNPELFPDVVYAYDVTYTVSTLDSTTGTQQHKEYKQFVRSIEAGEEFVENKRAEIEADLSSTQSIVADAVSYSIQPQSSMVIIDYNTGYVPAIAGGRGEKVVNRGFNRATDSMRQPGSVFKVLAAYAPAVDMSIIMPGSIIVDEPFEVAEYSPSNWYGENYRGPSTAREGIEQSMNILAVKVMDMVGVDTAYKYLLNFGFTTLQNDNHLSTALGGITYGVTQLEVTAAYGAIANGGMYYEPTFYTKVYDHDGNILLDNTEREPVQILKESTAFMLTDMMEGVLTRGTGTAAKLSSMPVAGKTGTTQETKDLTFVGYTPYYVAGIWLGYDRYDTIVPNMMATIEGSRVIANDTFHLKLWKDIMEKVHEDLPVLSFSPQPSDVISMTVCGYSGDLVSTHCSDKVTDYFLRGTEPTKYCDSHVMLNICSSTNLLANQYCGQFIVQRASSSTSPTDFCARHTISNPGTIQTTSAPTTTTTNTNITITTRQEENYIITQEATTVATTQQVNNNIFDFDFDEIINPPTTTTNSLGFDIGDIIGTTVNNYIEPTIQTTTFSMTTTQAPIQQTTTVPMPSNIVTEAMTQAPIITEAPTQTTTQAPLIQDNLIAPPAESNEPVFTLP
ncbi:MAG: transglycosylase domain-containing protein [bacterium]